MVEAGILALLYFASAADLLSTLSRPVITAILALARYPAVKGRFFQWPSQEIFYFGIILAWINPLIFAPGGIRAAITVFAVNPWLIAFTVLVLIWELRKLVAKLNEPESRMTVHLPILRIWTEVFHKAGDIYYQRLLNIFAAKNITPHFIIEQAVEVKPPIPRPCL